MLARTSYPSEHLDSVRALVASRVALYDDLVAGAPAADRLAPAYFADLVVLLDACFQHRARGKEGKDGNPMNEVRVVAGSVAAGSDLLVGDPTIRLRAETSVLGLADGDPLVVERDGFVRLAEAYLQAVARAFPAA